MSEDPVQSLSVNKSAAKQMNRLQEGVWVGGGVCAHLGLAPEEEDSLPKLGRKIWVGL